MRNILILLSLFLISTGYAFAVCGYHPPEAQVQARQRSSVAVTEDVKNFKKFAIVSKKEARKVATSQYPGKVKAAELITEDGTLVWKLEVKGERGQKELFIDPANGTFLG